MLLSRRMHAQGWKEYGIYIHIVRGLDYYTELFLKRGDGPRKLARILGAGDTTTWYDVGGKPISGRFGFWRIGDVVNPLVLEHSASCLSWTQSG